MKSTHKQINKAKKSKLEKPISKSYQISFSPPDITDAEINEVVDALRSGWITTGPRTKKFESNIATYCGIGEKNVI